MRITNRKLVPQKRDLRHPAEASYQLEGSAEKQDKPRIKLASRDKPTENVFKRPPSKMRPTTKNTAGLRIGPPKTTAADGLKELRPPSPEAIDLFKRGASRSGRLNQQDLGLLSKNSYKARGFQLRKDKQIYDKVWNAKEEDTKKNTPNKFSRYDNDETEEKSVQPDIRMVPRQSHLTQEQRSRNSTNGLTDLNPQTLERKNHYQKDSSHLTVQRPPQAHKSENQVEERTMFRIKSRVMNPQHVMVPRTVEEIKEVDSHPVVNELPIEQTTFESFEHDEEDLLAEIKSLLTNVSHPCLVESQDCSEAHLKEIFNQPTWAKVWRRKKLLGAKVLEDQIVGIILYQLDTSHFKSRRVVISHFSLQDFSQFDSCLKEAVAYIFNTDSCTEIFVQFKHMLEDGKLALAIELKEGVKNAGFRWRMLTNNSDGSRQTVFEAKRNIQVYPLTRESEVCHEPIKQSSFCLLSERPVSNDRQLLRSERQFRMPYDRTFLAFATFLKYINYKYDGFSSETLRDLGKLGELISIARSNPDFKFDGIESSDVKTQEFLNSAMNTAFEGCGEKTDLDLLFEEDKIALKTIAATFKSAMRLKYINGTQTEAMPFRYIRSRYEGRHLLPKTLSSVYVLPTLEDDLKLIVVQFATDRAKKFAVSDLVVALGNESLETGNIWLPQFRIDSGMLNDAETLSKAALLCNDKPKTMASRNVFEVSMELDKDMLKIREQSNDAIIRGEFVTGLISKELLSSFKIPIFMTLVTKAHFIEV